MLVTYTLCSISLKKDTSTIREAPFLIIKYSSIQPVKNLTFSKLTIISQLQLKMNILAVTAKAVAIRRWEERKEEGKLRS